MLATDLEDLTFLIEKNVDNNKEIINLGKGLVQVAKLNWAMSSEEIFKLFKKLEIKEVDYILAADVIFNNPQLELFSQVINKK